MKTFLLAVFEIALILFLYSCSSQKLLNDKTNRFIERKLSTTDTIFLYSIGINDLNLAWYHQGDKIYSYTIKPLFIKKHKPFILKNISVSDSSINECFDTSLYKDVKCFYLTFDGETINLYINGKTRLFSSIDTDCLFRQEYRKNTIQYKLQYELSRLFIREF